MWVEQELLLVGEGTVARWIAFSRKRSLLRKMPTVIGGTLVAL